MRLFCGQFSLFSKKGGIDCSVLTVDLSKGGIKECFKEDEKSFHMSPLPGL